MISLYQQGERTKKGTDLDQKDLVNLVNVVSSDVDTMWQCNQCCHRTWYVVFIGNLIPDGTTQEDMSDVVNDDLMTSCVGTYQCVMVSEFYGTCLVLSEF